MQTHLVDQCIAGPTSEAMQLFSLRRRKSFQPSTTALRFVEDPRLHSCPYGSNGTQGTRKSLFLVLFYIYIGSGRESRPVLFPAGSQGLPLRYPFSQNHHAKLCGTWQVPMLRSFANRHPLAASADILALPLRKDRFCHLYPFPAKIARHIP